MEYYAIKNYDGKFYDIHQKEWGDVPTIWTKPLSVQKECDKHKSKGIKCFVTSPITLTAFTYDEDDFDDWENADEEEADPNFNIEDYDTK